MASSTLESSSGNMNEGASDKNPADLNKEKNPSSSTNDPNRRCTCKRIQCLKFYCNCFNSGNLCNDSCSCKNCLNNEANMKEIKKNTRLLNPDAFESKIEARNRNGCHCSKAECMNSYCGCVRNGVACTLNCLCHGCKNKYGIKGSSSQAKEQDSNNGSKNVETMVTGSSSQSPHANSLTQLSETCAGMDDDDEMGNSNVNDIPMPMPSNQVAEEFTTAK
ncbi:hypothetical protein PIB30_063422 [Stylosanthes scabra]|uniref:CRC domain-containing protein n=1 Tax=Stylosanthes scabra TaxID=79078 RepID=A0ABU6VLL3_9FABA|nr:hypothetical protein [Stylosanthes scabra]